MSSKRKDVISAELERIRLANGGRLTPAAVVLAAKSPKNPLHKEFDWNDKSAAYTARLDTARDLIVHYQTVVVIHDSQKITVPFYVRDPTAKTNEQGYIPVTSDHLERKHAQTMVIAELDRCKSAILRARAVAGVLNQKFPGLSDQLEGLLESIIRGRGMLEAAE